METTTTSGTSTPATQTASGLTRRNIKFQTKKLASFAIFDAPAEKVLIEVLNNVSERNLVKDEEGREHYIVTVKAIAADKYEEAVARFQGKLEVPIEETNGLFMSLNVWKNEMDLRPALPMRGEKINASIGWVDNKDKTGRVLRIVGYSLNPAVAPARKFDLAAIGIQEEVPATPVATSAGTGGVRENELVK